MIAIKVIEETNGCDAIARTSPSLREIPFIKDL